MPLLLVTTKHCGVSSNLRGRVVVYHKARVGPAWFFIFFCAMEMQILDWRNEDDFEEPRRLLDFIRSCRVPVRSSDISELSIVSASSSIFNSKLTLLWFVWDFVRKDSVFRRLDFFPEKLFPCGFAFICPLCSTSPSARATETSSPTWAWATGRSSSMNEISAVVTESEFRLQNVCLYHKREKRNYTCRPFQSLPWHAVHPMRRRIFPPTFR